MDTTLNKTLLAALLGAALWLAPTLVVGAEPVAETEGEIIVAQLDANRLSDQEMGELRGGFIDPAGIIVRFAVDVKTMMDGALMFVRSFVLQPDQNGQLQVTTNAQILQQNVPSGTSVTELNQGKGVEIKDQNGNTTVLNQTTQGTFANMIINSASNRNITQNMNVDLVLNNLQNSLNNAAATTGQLTGFTSLYQAGRPHLSGFRF